jgi:hypothetical protein
MHGNNIAFRGAHSCVDDASEAMGLSMVILFPFRITLYKKTLKGFYYQLRLIEDRIPFFVFLTQLCEFDLYVYWSNKTPTE